MAERTTIAVDLAKSVFEIAVSSRPGRVAERHRLSRSQLMRYFGQRSAATVLLEACGSAHFWAREIERCGHRVVLLPPQHVRRYRPRNKTDRADAKALLEAFLNEEIRPVPVKTPEQQQLAALQRLRSAWLGTRTARMNNLRGLLREQGVTIPVGARHVVPRAFELAGDVESVLSDALRFALLELAREIRDLERRLDELEKRLAALARESEHVLRLQTIPGIGLITATALAGVVGDLRRFPSGRRFASYLGLIPRERSSGAVRRLGAISKRGDTYLRMLLIHGARAVLAAAPKMKQPDAVRSWALPLAARVGHNKATVALANKLARCAWAVASRERGFMPQPTAA